MGREIKREKNKGFTLVELIVVIVILAILAAILVPALLGYIDRSKDQKYILEAKELMTATQAGIAEAYALTPDSFRNAIRDIACSRVNERYGYYTNYALNEARNGRTMSVSPGSSENGVAAKNIISKRVVQYADSYKYNFASGFDNKGQKVSALGDKAGFSILFNIDGKIIFMQYARDGRLVTFDGTRFTVETGKNLTFESLRN